MSFCRDSNLCCTAIDDDGLNSCCTNETLSDNKFDWDDATLTGYVNASTLYDVYDSRQAIAGAMTNSTSNDPISGTPSNNEDSNTVSKGAIIGVGVGLGVPLLIALAACAWLFFAQKKERLNRHSKQEVNEYTDDTKHTNGGFVMSSQVSQNESAQEHLAPSGNGYASEPKGPHYTPWQQPLMQQQPPAELPNDRAPVEAHP